MPISFDVEALRKETGCETYLETGLYDPREDVSCRKALSCGFTKLYTIELRRDWVDLARKEYAKDVKTSRLTIIHDDSVNLSKYISENKDFDKRAFFFLDAHVDNSLIKNYSTKCPIVAELSAIKQLARKDNIICVDDMRIMRTPFPWGESSMGSSNVEQKIKELILDINPEYKFKYLDGYVPGDVLCAFI
jgi:hypothetical protein